MNLEAKIAEKIPQGFVFHRYGGKVCMSSEKWEMEMERLARSKNLSEAGDIGTIQYLQGRGCPIVVPFDRGKLIVRHYYHGGCLRNFTGDLFLGISRFLNELRIMDKVHRDGIPVPEPVGLILNPAIGGFYRADFVSVYISDSCDLRTYYENLSGNPSPQAEMERHKIIRRSARAIAVFHRAGFLHADLQMKNILIQKINSGLKVFILDFDKARRGDCLREKLFRANLIRLYRSFGKMRLMNPQISSYDPIRFVQAYAPDDRELRKRIIREGRRRRGQEKFRLLKWRITLRLRGSPYARKMSPD